MHKPPFWSKPTLEPRPLSEAALIDVKTCLFRRDKIHAIKTYRECTGSGLAEAKAAVEQIERELRASAPEKFTGPPPRMHQTTGASSRAWAFAFLTVGLGILLWPEALAHLIGAKKGLVYTIGLWLWSRPIGVFLVILCPLTLWSAFSQSKSNEP